MRLNEEGFTLLEVVLAMGIGAMLLYVMCTALRLGMEQMDSAELRMNIQESAREGLYKMIQEIRLSSPSRITLAGCTVASPPTNCTSIQFRTPDPSNPVNADYTVNWTSSQRLQYSLAGTGGRQVIRTNLANGLTTVLANDVTALQFTGNSTTPSVVTAVMSVQRTLKNGKLVPLTALQVTSQAEVRNA